MKLGWTDQEMMKWLTTTSTTVSDLIGSYWWSTPGKQAWTLTETLYQFDIQLSDHPIF